MRGSSARTACLREADDAALGVYDSIDRVLLEVMEVEVVCVERLAALLHIADGAIVVVRLGSAAAAARAEAPRLLTVLPHRRHRHARG